MKRNVAASETGMNPFEQQAGIAEQIRKMLDQAFNDQNVSISGVTPELASALPENIQQIYTLFSGVTEAKKNNNFRLLNRLRPDVFSLLSQMSYPEQMQLLGKIVQIPKNK